jgi:DNA-directed RNA polymerase subunit RPC12/RpoP
MAIELSATLYHMESEKAAAMMVAPKVRCKECGNEFEPERDADFIEWFSGGEAVECPYCGAACEAGKDDEDRKEEPGAW